MTSKVMPARRQYLAALASGLAGGLAGRLALAGSSDHVQAAATLPDPSRWSDAFVREVDHRVDIARADQLRYILMLQHALTNSRGLDLPAPALSAQAFMLVDRNPLAQVGCIVLHTPPGGWEWVGAAAVSTGKVGSFEHFLTPLGVFAHTLDNPDFRSQGTFNKNHIRGYGLRGMRIFDFGWQQAERGWGRGGTSTMRLQMHATDPVRLEARLGQVASEGCVRIPATLNVFLDRHGILDADYEQRQAAGKSLWVLKPGRQLVPWPGQYLVVVDSQPSSQQRPAG
jgi:hypothetical protein